MKKIMFVMCVLWLCLISGGCGTMSASGNAGVSLNPAMEQEAAQYRDKGQHEKAIEVYRQLLAKYPKHFRSVHHQYEILWNMYKLDRADQLNDSPRLYQELRKAVTLFETASAQRYEGATDEAIQQASAALAGLVADIGRSFHKKFQDSRDREQFDYASLIYETYIYHFPKATDYCEILYYHADLTYFGNKEFNGIIGAPEKAGRGFEQVLEQCDESKFASNGHNIMLDVAHGAVLAYAEWDTASENCKSTDEYYKAKEEAKPGNYHPIPLPECKTAFIRAADRYARVLEDYRNQPELYQEHLQFVNSAYVRSSDYYYEYLHIEEALSYSERALNMIMNNEELLHKVNTTPKNCIPALFIIADIMIKSYICMAEWEKVLDTIEAIRQNPAIMGMESWRDELFRWMDEVEIEVKAVLDKS